MRIIVDAMGGDNAPVEIIKGSVMAAEELGLEVVLTGRGEEILRCLGELGYKDLPRGIEVANASEVVLVEDDPANVIRTKKDSSLVVGLRLLRDGGGDAFVSAGSTGAVLSGATLIVKRIHGIRRAALAPIIPSSTGGSLLVDCGANVECTPEYLLQFAYMGSFYMKKVKGIENPRVGLVNNGTERTKGPALQRETWQLLSAAGEAGRINFIGNIEGREVLLGGCDVAVSDGFSGNVLLKGAEGMGLLILQELKNGLMSSTKSKVAAALLKDTFKDLKKRFDVSEVGGTLLLGISKTVVKAHGSCDAYAFRSAIVQAVNAAEANIAEDVSRNIDYMKLGAEE